MKKNTVHKDNYYGDELLMPCQCCGKILTKEMITVHHIIPQQHIKKLKGCPVETLPEQKLSFLCRDCHDKVETYYTSSYETKSIRDMKISIKKEESITYLTIYAYSLNIYNILYRKFINKEINKIRKKERLS